MPGVSDKESQLLTRLTGSLARSIVPLFTESDGKPRLVGTGFLVASAEHSYLISAAHVLDELQAGRLFLYVEPNTTRKLTGILRMTKIPAGKDRTADRLDVGVLLLQGPALPPYPVVDKECLPLSSLLAGALPREGKQYLMVGFPGSKSRPNPVQRQVSSQVCAFRNISAPAESYAQLGRDQNSHIIVPFNRDRTLLPNGKTSAFPDPHGMSGSPVWLLYDEQASNDRSRTPVVGVAIEYHKDRRVLVATDVGLVVDMIGSF